ncbi:DNA-3-methyladenine glycosylase family protein [Jannaschia sp. KMU-145]|uniref:DNA-3-methyladenine glycosylase family protein n=1 Tax=Jannaschia halovivens TaxID=3388667 RepID=UPI00396AF18D
MRIIAGPDDVAEGAAWLAGACPRMAAALDRVGPLPLRRREDGFGALLSAIVGQQVSVASALAINGRLADAGLVTEVAIRASTEDDLKACGLSRQKMRYARALAEAGIDWTALRVMPTDEVVATLTAVPGIGAWTAEIYAMFSLGHADVFAPGDLALQEGARMVYGQADRPTERALRAWSADWSPWRSVAARLFWAYYAREKRREGIA